MPLFTPLTHTPLLPGTLENLFYPPRVYTYFERAKAVPFATGAVIAKAAWAADAAMLGYARYGATRMTDEELAANFARGGLTAVKIGGTSADWNLPGTQAVFASCGDFAIVSFRGTERDDPHDLVSDCDVALVHEPDYRPAAGDPAPALGHLDFITHLFASPCLVHRGFQHALDEVWPHVHELVTAYRAAHAGSEICFTGHSLGAALATVAFSRFADPNISLYTFGCPRVGNSTFRDRVMSNAGRGIYRFVNFNDAVTHVPLESVAYRHAPAECYKIADNGDIDADRGSFLGDVAALRTSISALPIMIGTNLSAMAPPSVVDHSPARYCFRLWDCN